MINDLSKVIVGQHLTEKASRISAASQYVFKIHPCADKSLVKKAVEKAFNVKVAAVNVINMQGKTRRYGTTMGRKSDWKKAYVTLEKGYSINLETEASKG